MGIKDKYSMIERLLVDSAAGFATKLASLNSDEAYEVSKTIRTILSAAELAREGKGVSKPGDI